MADFSEAEILEYKKAMKKYFLECAIMEGSKIAIFFMIFFFLHMLPQFFMGLFMLMIVRIHGGGLHFKHYLSCLIVSFIVLAGTIFLGVYIPVPLPYSVVMLLISVVTGYALVPIVSENRPKPDAEQARQSKFYTVGIILIYSVLICICPYSQYLNIGTWTVYIHIIQLLLAKFTKRRC